MMDRQKLPHSYRRPILRQALLTGHGSPRELKMKREMILTRIRVPVMVTRHMSGHLRSLISTLISTGRKITTRFTGRSRFTDRHPVRMPSIIKSSMAPERVRGAGQQYSPIRRHPVAARAGYTKMTGPVGSIQVRLTSMSIRLPGRCACRGRPAHGITTTGWVVKRSLSITPIHRA